MKGYTYILQCADGSYYTGSTKYLTLRIQEHQEGNGANHTKSRLPVKLVYVEEFERIDFAFNREKQIQGWSRAKKEALINGHKHLLNDLSSCQNESNYLASAGFGFAQPPLDWTQLTRTSNGRVIERSRNESE